MEFSIDFRQNRNRDKEQAAWMSEFCRQKLIGYAESFRELSRSCYVVKKEESGDRQKMLEEQKIEENRLVMSENLNAMAHVMDRVAEEMGACRPMEERKSRLLSQALRAEGLFIGNLYYLPEETGRNSVGMTIRTEKRSGRLASDAADMLSVLLHRQVKLSATSPYLIDDTEKWFVFVEEASYLVLTGFARAVKEGENLSGDHYAIVESEQGRMSLILSDGTGSGEKACEESGRVLDLLEKLLEAGYDTETAVKMVNRAFYALGEEGNHPTLDVCELDLYRGSCDICKVGGAATFIKRGKGVERVAAENLPLGIFRTVEVEKVHKKIGDGEYVIMVTDGVLDALEEAEYRDPIAAAMAEMEQQILSKPPVDSGSKAMAELLEMIEEQNPGEIAEKLLHTVLCLSGGRIRDDMTILVAGIWENEGIF